MSEAVVRKRGDTYAVEMTIVDKNGAVQDINGKAFVLTVNSVERPADASTELFQLVGVVTDAALGAVEFPMTDEQANHVGEFYYDVEMTDDGETVVLLDSFGVDGTEMEVDGNGGPWVTQYLHGSHTDPDTFLLAETRDSRRVVRWKNPEGFGYTDWIGQLRLSGAVFPARSFNPLIENIEATALFYLAEAAGVIRFDMPGNDHWIDALLKVEANDDVSVICGGWVHSPNKIRPDMYFDSGSPHAGEGPGWYWSKVFLEKGLLSVRTKYWKYGDDEPGTWETSATPNTTPSYPCLLSIYCSGNVTPLSAAHVGDCAVVKFRTWS